MWVRPARAIRLHQFRRQALRPQETAPGHLHVAPQDRLADFRDMARGGVEDRVHHEHVPGAQPLQLLQFRGHRFRRAAAVPFALDERVGAIAAPEAAAALGLKVQRAVGSQNKSGRLPGGPVGFRQLSSPDGPAGED